MQLRWQHVILATVVVLTICWLADKTRRQRGTSMPRLTAVRGTRRSAASRPRRPRVSPVKRERPDVPHNWAFRPLRLVPVPSVAGPSNNGIDAFVRQRLESEQLRPAGPASRTTLIRRLYYGLLGRPPSATESESFQAATGPLAYPRLVERLLASPAYGERWARHWLDIARFADSNGYEYDEYRHHAYPYRDYVIRALNRDQSMAAFLQWQIAGDELQPQDPQALAATGFLTAGPYNTFFTQEIERFDELDDIVSTIGTGMLGLTVGCARCHDHKYDPIPTQDYYHLIAIFMGTSRKDSFLTPDQGAEYLRKSSPFEKTRQERLKLLKKTIRDAKIDALPLKDEEKELLKQPTDSNNARQAKLLQWAGTRLQVHDEEVTDETKPRDEDRDRCQELKKKMDELEPDVPDVPPIGLTISGSQVAPCYVLEGGDPERKSDSVAPGFLTALTPGFPRWDSRTWQAWCDRRSWPAGPTSPLEQKSRAQPRTALANWLTDTERGAGQLAARVLVNRLWQHHFGRGLVENPSDFGTQTTPPLHLELLDWLAFELIENGWSLKHLQRLITTSATYQLSAAASDEHLRRDPDNLLWARRRPQRLSADALRDAILVVGGNMNAAMYGPGIQPAIPKEAIFHVNDDVDETWPTTVEDAPAIWRRSIYIIHKRSNPVPLLDLYDAPDAGASCGRRRVTTVPTQALALLNEDFLQRQSKRFADRVLAEARQGLLPGKSPTPRKLIERTFLIALSRLPTNAEFSQCLRFLSRHRDNSGRPNVEDALARLCHVVLLTNEFIYID